jgi:hypothetical protein
MEGKNQRKQLRKQPRRRRTYSSSAVNYPNVTVPKTAKKRRRRHRTEGVRFGLSALKRIIFSSRWISLGLLAITIFALVVIVQERRFYLTYVPVDGTISLEREEIVAASELAGSHVFSVDPAEAAAKITELPGVISATVMLEWPNQVLIEIAEEEPVAVWQEDGVSYGITEGGRLVPVSFPLTGLLQIVYEDEAIDYASPPPVAETVAEGDVPAEQDSALVEEDSAEGTQETVDNGSILRQANPGSGAPANDNSADEPEEEAESEPSIEADLGTSFTFVPQEVLDGALSLRTLRPSINALYYRPSDGLSYQDERGWRVHFGAGTDMNQKLVLYETILDDLLLRGINPRYISVSNKSKPYYLAQ